MITRRAVGDRTQHVGEASASVQAAIYRVSQEALANIYRHSGAERATFRLVARERYLHLVIRDDGVGIQVDPRKPVAVGVGLMGMEERVGELGGRLSIHHSAEGTSLTVSFPREKRMIFSPVVGA